MLFRLFITASKTLKRITLSVLFPAVHQALSAGAI